MIKAGNQDISHVVIAMMDEFLQENADGTYTITAKINTSAALVLPS